MPRPCFLFCALLLCSTLLCAQTAVTEITAMTVPNSWIDMDSVGPAGPTTIPRINLAGTNGGGCLANIILTPSSTTVGTYNTNPGQGRALGLDPSGAGLVLVDPPAGTFLSFTAQIDLAMDCTEIGLSIGDYNGSRSLDFYSKGQLVVGGFATSSFTGTSLLKYFQMSGATFDRVDITSAPNWVIPDIVTQIPPNSYTPFGFGCPGNNGTPCIMAQGASTPQLGTLFLVDLTNAPLPGGPAFMALGTSAINLGASPLPFDVTPLGAPGCSIWTSWFIMVPFGTGGGSGTWPIPIPQDPNLLGGRFYNQAFIIDPTANPLGLLLSNAAVGTIVK